MSSRLPVLSGEELVKAREIFGYILVRQKGSHMRLRHGTDPQRKPVTVPRHKTVKRGLLHDILRDARITVEELVSIL